MLNGCSSHSSPAFLPSKHHSLVINSSHENESGTWKISENPREHLGHIQGPLVEERLLRLVAGRAAALGASSLRCRARFTESWKQSPGKKHGKKNIKISPVKKPFWGYEKIPQWQWTPSDSNAAMEVAYKYGKEHHYS